MKYDAVIVLGTGIKHNGILPESCLSNVKKAIELYKDKLTSKLIFSGKWAWNYKYTPPFTEAVAMKKFALNRGVPEFDILIEDSSTTIGSNLCLVKEKILIPNNFTNIALVCISDVIKERSELNLTMILGPGFTYEIVMADSTYTPEKYEELKQIEARKIIEARLFYKNVIPGDHQKILRLGQADINKKLKKL